ncbi:MAG: hypothetical protein WCR36_06255 [Bacteroidaceae bacterium]
MDILAKFVSDQHLSSFTENEINKYKLAMPTEEEYLYNEKYYGKGILRKNDKLYENFSFGKHKSLSIENQQII